jgi:hypothetical protein
MRGAHHQQHAGSADSVGLRVLTSQTRAWNLMNKPGNCKTGTSNTCLRPDISRHVLYTMRDEPHSEGLDDISVPSVKWRSTGRGLLANGWAESPVTAAATTAVVANKVPMVRKKTGSGQVERHEGCDVMCSGMGPELIRLFTLIFIKSQSLAKSNHDQDLGCFNSSIHARKLQDDQRELRLHNSIHTG